MMFNKTVQNAVFRCHNVNCAPLLVKLFVSALFCQYFMFIKRIAGVPTEFLFDYHSNWKQNGDR